MSSEVFVLSAVRNPEPAEAVRLAVERAQVNPARIQDALFGVDESFTAPDLQETGRKAGLTCPVASVSSSMRAVFFGAQSILAESIPLVIAAGLDGQGTCALVLGGPEAIGRWNLVPQARLAARSLQGPEAALRQAEVKSEDLAVVKKGGNGASLLHELLDDLGAREGRWGMVVVGELALLVERV